MILVKLCQLVQLDVRRSQIMNIVILKLEKHLRRMGLAGTLTLSKDQQLAIMLLARYRYGIDSST